MNDHAVADRHAIHAHPASLIAIRRKIQLSLYCECTYIHYRLAVCARVLYEY
jgi:hypothetical protein